VKRESLRPIGTEFWYAYPVSCGESGAVQRRFLYRIVAHDELGPSLEYGERLEAIRTQDRRVTGIRFVELSDRTAPEYTFDDWTDS
jgi:hypothetical protein